MDYEKAYKESFEAAKGLHDAGNALTRRQMEIVFPQLAESEDERIRKALIEVFKEKLERGFEWVEYGIPNRSVLSWLEKQKERKQILEVFGFKVGDAVRLKDGDGRKHIIKSFEEVEGLHGPNFYHVDFEDNSARSGIYPDEEYPNGYYTQMEKFEKEQKPVEPSDEELQRHQDELYDFKVFAAKQAREHHISFVHDFEWNNFCGELLSYFNEKQKPAEWSEEDEDMLNSCISSIEEAKENRYAYKETDGDTSYDHEIAWLKSLRNRVGKESLQSHWKPTEEQMDVLLNTEGMIRASGYPENAKVLASLYEALKKL